MEGKYTKISAIAGIIALAIAGWQIIPGSNRNYSGEWKMTLEIEQAHLSQYIGSKVEWQLHLTQTDKSVSGNAEKIAVNSAALNYKDRTALTFQGVIQNDEFNIHYTEKGKTRPTNGIFKGKFSGDEFTGTFSQTASDSRGKISGYKMK